MNSLKTISNVPETLDAYEPAGIDLSPEYWTPKEPGESRRLIFLGTEPRLMPSADDPAQLVELECALFVQPGTPPKIVANGSKRLVGVFEAGKVETGTPLEITYRGEEKNTTNSKTSHAWSVVPLKRKDG